MLLISALVMFFVGLDLLSEASKLPDSANLVSLYILFKTFYSLEMVMPIALVFASIATKVHLIRANELVASYSLGASRYQALKPFILVATIFALTHILASSTDFAYSYEKANAIKKDSFYSSVTTDLFLKVDNSFVYIEQLYPLQNEAKNIEILEIRNKDLAVHIKAKRAFFKNGAWHLDDVVIVHKPEVKSLQKDGIKTERLTSYKALEGFRPDIMDKVYESKTAYSLIDAVDALVLFGSQEINTDKLRGILYSSVMFPFFAPIVLVIIFLYLPISSRFFNMALFSSLAVATTLIGWGVLFTLSQLSRNGTISPELGLLLPFGLLALFAGYLVKKEL